MLPDRLNGPPSSLAAGLSIPNQNHLLYNMNMNRRYSQKREQILDVLKKEYGVLSASAIHSKLPELNLTTIYRNLDMFVASGVVKKLQLGGNEAVYEYAREPHHHAVCTECERVIHFTAPNEKITKLLGLTDFEVDEIDVTVRGTCNHK